MPKIFPFQVAKTTTLTYTSSQSIAIPAGVTSLNYVSGKGADGTPATSGYYEPNKNQSAYVTSVSGQNNNNGGSVGYPGGTLYWDYMQSNGSTDVKNINGGGSGTIARYDYTQYSNGYSLSTSSVAFNNAVPGSAYTYTSGGWKTTGPVVNGDIGFMYVAWQEYGDYVSGDPATTGASATGFGYTFPGGNGGAASPSTFNNVAVVPGQAYQLNIPSGGSITIQYITS